ncbi:hypothetical protein [cf. Phormidesmis sp. LEGE 11477]|uniref:hypothetical protein n=1 Tax=cf. Phormidesmis sp. LEGE 11477 TaxID=1828680 RepID=UPI001881F6A0|nr:hypothetical protein [cf. Phormidesmis sp. LEGE 11477]MBE9062035.1 hypothetical protein [cf. Phormidesmis sp. LEGE 11477]
MTPASDDSLARIESKLDILTDGFGLLRADVDELKTDVSGLKTDVGNLKTNFDRLETNLNLFDSKFSNYQQATQWVVQLAFTLIASATVTVIISTVR